jgi:hypothetical protein
MYLLYAIVLLKQTQVMNGTLTVGRSGLILFISFLHVVAAIVLIAFAILLL